MEFHEIDLKGRTWLQEVAALPAWHSSFERRILYRNTDQTLWFGTSSGWMRIPRGNEDNFLKSHLPDVHAATITPSADNAIDLGSVGLRYANVHSVVFTGIVTTATYADLAEKYTMPEEYPIGTIVEVSDDERYDLVSTNYSSKCVVGVVSEKPGFLMNSEMKSGVAVGMVGRLPVRIVGPVYKKDPIKASRDGAGRATTFNEHRMFYIIGYALETNTDEDEKLVECIIK